LEEEKQMKHMYVSALALAVVLYAAPTFAQHGHEGGNMGGTMGGTMGHGASDHASPNTPGGSNSSQRVTIDQQLSRNTHLAGQIQKLTGMSASQACSGFKNLGQCVAAAHVSKNLGISFDCMRSDMTKQAPLAASSCPAGTGTKSMSLGKTIQTLDPTVNSKAEAKKGTDEANQDLKQSSSS
jgi:hypothetical protein